MSDDKPDLAAVLDFYGVIFKPDRSSQKVLCPVHEEHVQSCSIDLDEGFFNCHACNAKGDSWNLIMLKEGCDFATAVRTAKDLAFTSGTNVPSATDTTTDGLFGRQRAGRRDGGKQPFRPSLRSLGRS